MAGTQAVPVFVGDVETTVGLVVDGIVVAPVAPIVANLGATAELTAKGLVIHPNVKTRPPGRASGSTSGNSARAGRKTSGRS